MLADNILVVVVVVVFEVGQKLLEVLLTLGKFVCNKIAVVCIGIVVVAVEGDNNPGRGAADWTVMVLGADWTGKIVGVVGAEQEGKNNRTLCTLDTHHNLPHHFRRHRNRRGRLFSCRLFQACIRTSCRGRCAPFSTLTTTRASNTFSTRRSVSYPYPSSTFAFPALPECQPSRCRPIKIGK